MITEFHIQPTETVSLQCHPQQKLRGTICCYPVKCSPGQEFMICTEDQGHDTCQNCPKGFTHFDDLDSKDWDYQLKPCIEKDECSESDLAIIDGNCSCNRNEGYYGRDRHKCALDNGTCRKAGYQLTIDGDCVMCDENHFKVEKEKYGLCIPKTRCSNDQEIDHPGTSQKDRTCRAKNITVKNIQTLPPSSGSTNSSGYNTSNHTDKGYITRNKVHHTTTVGEIQGNKSNDNEWIILSVVSSVLFVGSIISIIFIIKVMRTNGTDTQRTGPCILSCCQNVNNTNIKADNVNLGDHNTMIIKPPSNKHDDDDGEREQFIKQNHEEV